VAEGALWVFKKSLISDKQHGTLWMPLSLRCCTQLEIFQFKFWQKCAWALTRYFYSQQQRQWHIFYPIFPRFCFIFNPILEGAVLGMTLSRMYIMECRPSGLLPLLISVSVFLKIHGARCGVEKGTQMGGLLQSKQ
jgi:hypothetical protein